MPDSPFKTYRRAPYITIILKYVLRNGKNIHKTHDFANVKHHQRQQTNELYIFSPSSFFVVYYSIALLSIPNFKKGRFLYRKDNKIAKQKGFISVNN